MTSIKEGQLPYNIVLFSYLFLIIVSKLYEHWANPSRIISIVEFVLFVLGITFWGKFPFGIMLIVLLPPIITSYFGLRWGGSFVIVVSILLFLFVSLNILNFLQSVDSCHSELDDVWHLYSLLTLRQLWRDGHGQYHRDARNLLDRLDHEATQPGSVRPFPSE